MNNRFYFRVWTGTQMLSDAAVCNGVYVTADWSEYIDFILMQCTGLKDKNGKLIYEGDIVQIFHVSGTMQGRLFTDVVEWNEQRCRFDTENYGVFDDDDVYEVIGNIYENKELLESEG